MTGKMYPCRSVLSLALSIGIPQSINTRTRPIYGLVCWKEKPTTAICQQWIWAGSTATEHISGSPPLSPVDRIRCRKPAFTLVWAIVYSRQVAIFARGSANVHAKHSPAIFSVVAEHFFFISMQNLPDTYHRTIDFIKRSLSCIIDESLKTYFWHSLLL